MQSYQVQLFETRLSEGDIDIVGDDVALFDVIRDDGESWRVATFLSPLFRVLHMDFRASLTKREQIVSGLGAREIVERLKQGWEPDEETFIVFGADYPGYPGEPALIMADRIVVDV